MSKERKAMTLKRMDNVLIVVDDLEAVKAFFIELGLELEGETTVEGPEVGKLIGLDNVRSTIAMLRTPDGQGIELDKFHTPDAIRTGPVNAPVTRWASGALCSRSRASTNTSLACAPAALKSSAKCRTTTPTAWSTSAAPRA
jgi:hypothetical protein